MSQLLKRLNVKYPILLAPMAGISSPLLAAEVSQHGALGALGLGAHSPDAARAEILKTKSLTDAPFQVNFFCHRSEPLDEDVADHWIDYLVPSYQSFGVNAPSSLRCIYESFLDGDDMLKVVLETKPAAVSLHFGVPHAHQVQALREAGIVTLATATNVAEARIVEAAGIDVVVAQGIEAGGHRGMFNPLHDSAITTANLVRLLRKHCSLPIVASGGIMCGRHIHEMLTCGADAVQLGTAFVQCESSRASAVYREALFDRSNCETQITSCISGRPARGLVGRWQLDIDTPERPPVPPYPYAYDIAKRLDGAARRHGDCSYGPFWAGSNVHMIRSMDTAQLIDQLIAELGECDQRWIR